MDLNQPDAIKIVPILLVGLGLLTVAVGYPLAQGKVAPNKVYGIRTKFAFSSTENWYKANRYGGQVFIRMGWLIAVIGLPGLFLPNAWVPVYAIPAALATVALVLGSTVVIFLGQSKDRAE